jgi:iron complex transport system permease protein
MQKSMTVGHSYLSKISTGTGKASLIKNKYARHIWVKALFLIGLACLIIIASAVIVTLGQVSMTVSQAYHAIVNWIVPGIFSVNPLVEHVVTHIRLPMILGAIIAGSGLGICGCVMQAVLKNPMASPFTLGISSGAHFGVSLAAVSGIVIVHGPYFLVCNAFLCALLCSGCIIAISVLKGATSETLVLAGIAVNYLFQGAIQTLSYIATDEQRTMMSFWGMGSLADLNWNSVLFLGVVSAICIPLLSVRAWDLNVMTVGDESAKSMGVNANQTRIFVMIVSSLLVAAIVAFIGVIGFVGLIAPHIGRMILGNNHRYLIPAAGGIGGALLLIANAVSMNLLKSVVIPPGLIMSMLGIPLFLYLIIKGKRREYWS